VLKPKGRIYCITDVKDLHDWHVAHLEKNSMVPNCEFHQFRTLQPDELTDDPCTQLIWNSTEEGKKVERNSGSKFSIVCERI
jgi:tRNA (guanine-N7-)-methyltransferase